MIKDKNNDTAPIFKKLNDLSEKGIKKLCDKVIYQRGVDYFLDSRVKNITIIGNSVIAEVHGNDIYEVEITEDEGHNIDINCTCPYSGMCKHSVAVLLVIYKDKNILKRGHQNQDYIGLELLEKNDLIKIIKEFTKENPKLLDKINKICVGEVIDIKSLNKKLNYLFNTFYDYQSMNRLIKELKSIRRIILGLISNNENQKAKTVLETIIHKIMVDGSSVDDSNGNLSEFLEELLTIVKRLFKEKEERVGFLNNFFDVYIKESSGYNDQLGYIFIELFEKDNSYLEGYAINKMNRILGKNIKNKRDIIYNIVTLLLDIYEETDQNDKYIALCKRHLTEYDDMNLVEKLMDLRRYREAFEMCDNLVKTKKASPFIREKFIELKNMIG